jgi:Ca-activated chloride channel family protein
MSIAASLVPDPEALFEEARRRQRRRQVRLLALAGAALAVGLAAYLVLAVTAHSSATGGSGVAAVAAAPRTRLVVVLVDVSGSMKATDVAPNRLVATQHALRLFLGRLAPDVKVAIVAFSDSAEVIAPPTTSRPVLLAALAKLTPISGTALGEGLVRAVDLATATLVREGVKPTHAGKLPAALVLVSDGAQNRGTVTPGQAARHALAAGVVIDGIALGTKNGRVKFGYGSYTNSVPVPPDPSEVQTVDGIAHGSTFLAPDGASLDNALVRLASGFNG